MHRLQVCNYNADEKFECAIAIRTGIFQRRNIWGALFLHINYGSVENNDEDPFMIDVINIADTKDRIAAGNDK